MLRFAALSLAALAIVVPGAAEAQNIRVSGNDSDTLGRIVARAPLRSARHAIVTRDGTTALLLTRKGVVLQFTEKGLERISSPTPLDDEGEQGVFARVVSSMVRGGVRALLDRGIEYPLSELREARYEHGRLYFVRNDGELIFEDVQVHDTNLMEGFSSRDARAFVARFREVKAAG